MNELKIFENTELNCSIRTQTDENGIIWFVAKDVCDSLGLVDVTSALRVLDDDEKMTLQNQRSHSGQRGGAQFLNIINESGLYKLTFRSNKPNAKKFTKWVTSEVLPDIRKHGIYLTDKAQEAMYSMSDFSRLLLFIGNRIGNHF